MPLPFIIGGIAAAGVGASVHGAKKMKEARETIEATKYRHERNLKKFEEHKQITSQDMDDLRKKELEVLKSFQEFSNVFEKIKNKPVFKAYEKGDVKIPDYNIEELKEVSIGAVGTTVLGTTLGFGLIVGGFIINFKGSRLSDQADEAWSQMKRAEESINKICDYLQELSRISNEYKESICKVDKIYQLHLDKLSTIVLVDQKNDWATFTEQEKLITENTVLLVNLLYNMGKVKLVSDSEGDELNKINKEDVHQSIENAESFLQDIQLRESFLRDMQLRESLYLDTNTSDVKEILRKIQNKIKSQQNKVTRTNICKTSLSLKSKRKIIVELSKDIGLSEKICARYLESNNYDIEDALNEIQHNLRRGEIQANMVEY